MGLTVIKWVGLLAVVVALSENLKSGRQFRLTESKQGKMFILLLAVVFLSWFMQGYWSLTQSAQMFTSFAIFFFVTLSMVNSAQRARLVMWTVVFCMFLASVDVIRDFRWYYAVYGINVRPGGLFRDPNYYALSALMVMPFIYYLLKTTTRAILRLGLYAILFVDSVALVLSLSRGAFVGLAGMVLTVILLSKKRSKAFVTLGVVIILVVQFAPDRLWERFSQTRIAEDEATFGTTASTTRRWLLVKAGVAMISDHPIKGVGIGQFKPASVLYEPMLSKPGVAHNTYLEMAAEMGLPALLLFLGIILYTYRDLMRMRRRVKEDPELSLLINALIVSMTGFVVAGNFLSGLNTKLFWLMVFVVIALKRSLIVQDAVELKESDTVNRGIEQAATKQVARC